eukprot:CAMPEP_0197719698 /NCGR_PEP_ID=MMETSP1434-20131217/3347_1 /TAXON_ID=265543 /ORGANISM="Minutocellus polymorphus, Strain CCMP3303" /LENGTH=285 /DNA_ID=CAMNT_0043304465 /DNA_START=261 /DNA_END=1118 /DNA_ORIENTATION=+
MGGSGTFQGHAIPASFFFGFGCFFLGLTFKRCRDLVARNSSTGASGSSSGGTGPKSFCDVHIPERSPVLLGWTSIILMIGTVLGMFYEALGGYFDGIGLFHQLAHVALYLCFFFVGAVTWLESRHCLPPDSSRVALSFAFFLQYILWNEHGLMKEDRSDARIHILQAQINLVASVAFAYSVYNPKSLLAYVSGWALMSLNALWMFTAGLAVCCVDIMLHTVGAALALEALLIAAILVVGASLCAGPRPAHPQLGGNRNNNAGGAYSSVASSMPSSSVDEEEGNDK